MVNLLGGHHTENQADSSQALSQHVTGSQLAGRSLSTHQSLSLQNKECTGQRWEAKLSDFCLAVHRTVSLGLQN